MWELWHSPFQGHPEVSLSILVALGTAVTLCILVALCIPVNLHIPASLSILLVLASLCIPVSPCSPAALGTWVALWCWWPCALPAPGQARLEPSTVRPSGSRAAPPISLPAIPHFLVSVPGFRPIPQLHHHLQPKPEALEQAWEGKAPARGIQGWFQLSQTTAPAQDGEAGMSTECQRLWMSKGFGTSLTPVAPWLEATSLQVSQ